MGEVPAEVPVAAWGDGSTVHSVVVPDLDGLDHEYWVVRNDQVLGRFPSLTAVDAWRSANCLDTEP